MIALSWILPAAVVAMIALLVKRKFESATPSVYVIGDLHGDVHCARHWVDRTGVIDEKGGWADPLNSLVFVGDYVDKGPTSKQTLEFVKSLTGRFPTHVTALMGNHEMELLLDRDERRHQVWGGAAYYQLAFSSAHPGEFRNFIGVPPTPAQDEDAGMKADQDELVIEALYNASIEVYSRGMHKTVRVSPSKDLGSNSILNFIPPDLKPLVLERMGVLQKNYIDAFRSGSELGTWLEQRPVLALVDETLFVHGGISMAASKQIKLKGVDGINKLLAENAKEEKLMDFIQGTEEGRVVYNMLTFRGNHQPGACSHLSQLLPHNATRLGVGHTPGDTIRVNCDNRFLAIDSSLGRWFRNSGNMYCPGHKAQISANGRYGCDAMKQQCEGQILKIQNNEIQIIS